MKFMLVINIGNDNSTVLLHADNTEDALEKVKNIYHEIESDAESVTITLSKWHTLESKQGEKKND